MENRNASENISPSPTAQSDAVAEPEADSKTPQESAGAITPVAGELNEDTETVIQEYPGGTLKNSYNSIIENIGGNSIKQESKVYETADSPLLVQKFFTEQFESPVVFDEGSGIITITQSERDILLSSEMIIISIKREEDRDKTRIVISRKSNS